MSMCDHATIVLFFVACKASTFDFGNDILNILNGIRLPSAPGSTFYVTHSPF